MAKKKWGDLTPAQRRVVIAKDALKTVQAGAYAGYSRGYISQDGANGFDGRCPEDIASPGDCEAVASNCSVCARGALLISRAVKFNKLTLGDLGLQDSVWNGVVFYGRRFSASAFGTADGLKGAFTETQLDKIEEAFESDWADNYHYSPAERFGASFPKRQERLIAILQNIIDHSGDFTPAIEYVIV